MLAYCTENLMSNKTLLKIKDLKQGNVYVLNGFNEQINTFFLIRIEINGEYIITKRLYKDCIFDMKSQKDEYWSYIQLSSS